MAIMVETKQLKIIRKQPILKKFKQQSSKQLTLIKFTKEYKYTKIFSWVSVFLEKTVTVYLTFYHLKIFNLLIHDFSDFHCLHKFFNFSFKDMH